MQHQERPDGQSHAPYGNGCAMSILWQCCIPDLRIAGRSSSRGKADACALHPSSEDQTTGEQTLVRGLVSPAPPRSAPDPQAVSARRVFSFEQGVADIKPKLPASLVIKLGAALGEQLRIEGRASDKDHSLGISATGAAERSYLVDLHPRIVEVAGKAFIKVFAGITSLDADQVEPAVKAVRILRNDHGPGCHPGSIPHGETLCQKAIRQIGLAIPDHWRWRGLKNDSRGALISVSRIKILVTPVQTAAVGRTAAAPQFPASVTPPIMLRPATVR